MLKLIKGLFKKQLKKQEEQKINLSPDIIEKIKINNLFKFTDNQTLLIKEESVIGKINKTEKIKPGTLAKGSLTFIHLFEAEVSNGERAEFLTFDKALEWLLQRTLTHWVS